MSATAPPKLPHGATLRAARAIDVGAVLDSKYRVESVLGRGGMAVVVAATHVTLGHRVAIKLLLPDANFSPSHAQRVLREARAAAGLTSENAARVLDIGALDSGEPYIVMELLDGVDLARLLREHGPLRIEDAATYLVQACDAIAEAHAKGIVHRDLKPGNLFLTKRPDGSPLVKLLDFGISKLVVEEPEESLTRTQDSLGTPHYMSPEQLLTARGVDTRTDVWALGIILYRLLTGEHAFTGETTPAVHIAVASGTAPRLCAKRTDAPAEMGELVAKCLVKSREERLQTVQQFAAALLPFTDADTRKRYARLVGSIDMTAHESSKPAVLPSPGLADSETRTTWDTVDSRGPTRVRRGAIAVGIFALMIGALAFVQHARQSAHTLSEMPRVTASAPADTAIVSATVVAPPPLLNVASSLATTSTPPSLPTTASVRRRFRSPLPTPTTTPAPKTTSSSDPYGQRR